MQTFHKNQQRTYFSREKDCKIIELMGKGCKKALKRLAHAHVLFDRALRKGWQGGGHTIEQVGERLRFARKASCRWTRFQDQHHLCNPFH